MLSATAPPVAESMQQRKPPVADSGHAPLWLSSSREGPGHTHAYWAIGLGAEEK